MLQTSVEIVNPGGTGSAALVISASPEPLPPSRSFMFRLPSALPLPKKYTYCFRLPLEAVVRFAAAFFAIVTPIVGMAGAGRTGTSVHAHTGSRKRKDRKERKDFSYRTSEAFARTAVRLKPDTHRTAVANPTSVVPAPVSFD